MSLAGVPTFVPDGYKLRARIVGTEAAGFIAAGRNQAHLCYTTGWSTEEWTYGLHVYVASGYAGSVGGTEEHAGVALEANPDESVVYQDGMWAIGRGEDEVVTSEGETLHWDRASTHSVTRRTPTNVFAAVGGKRSLDAATLAAVVRSI